MSGEEKRVERQITNYLDSLGAYYVKIHGSTYMPAGTSDLLCCVNGSFVAIEVKKPKGGIVSPLQKFKLKEVKNAGGVAFVARSVEDVKKELSKNGIV